MNEEVFVRYVLHSPYPDGTWRGLEKCIGCENDPEGLLMFETYDDAKAYSDRYNLAKSKFVVVQVRVTTPRVRTPVMTPDADPSVVAPGPRKLHISGGDSGRVPPKRGGSRRPRRGYG